MIKRSESKSKNSSRRRSDRASKKRRLMMEGLEKRELLAAGPLIPTVPNIPSFTGPRNVGTVQAFTYIESEILTETGGNDHFDQADVVPLGTGPGQQNTIDVTGSMLFTASPQDPTEFSTDIDTFAVDLKAGDILDISTQGAAGPFTVLDKNAQFWFGVDEPQPFGYPANSPLQSLGNSVFAQVVPEDGRYYISVAPDGSAAGNYTLGLRVYRPVIESLPIGTKQVLFVDFDGGFYPRSLFPDGTGIPQPGVARVPSLQQSLALLGIQIQNQNALNDLITKTMVETERMFAALGVNGTNGDYDSTGNPGDYGITLLNSRDHGDPGSHPMVSRVVFGGTDVDTEIAPFARASSIDIGNFNFNDTAAGSLESIQAFIGAVQLDPSKSQLDAIANFLALLVAHESGHYFGMRHTTATNLVINIMDEGGGAPADVIGAGFDGIFGTIDDIPVDFRDDLFTFNEGLFEGTSFTAAGLSHALATGKAGGAVSGRVFRDANRDGSGGSDLGLSGVTVFADINGNGVADPSEPTAVSGADGTYVMSMPPGTFNVIAVTPIDNAPTTPIAVSTGTAVGSTTSGVDFGFSQVIPNITGTVFSDNDGNGLRDPGEGGVEGVYVYIDIDGDDRPDLGEPGTNSLADGSYSLNFPGPGTYTIREVLEPGFELTFPAGGEHTVVFDGVSLSDNYDFGNFPSRDLGDAPDSYGTTTSADGASHGITAGLTIGSVVDREVDGQPSVGADGDDFTGIDDEDGVRLLSPLGPSDSATFEVTVTNTTGAPAFLQAFIDFDRDGNFTDPGEQFKSDVPVPSGTIGGIIPLDVTVPPGASVGTTYTRFRLSQSSGLGPGGFAATGEVEDYAFPILDAAEIANDDEFTVSRNTLSNQLDVLANDFQTFDNQLLVDSLNVNGTAGAVVRAGDQKSVFYTPPNGFIGRDVFGYTVVDEFGTRSSASVVVNVTFQSNIPIAIDDTFEVPEGSVNRALNVLDNDVPSTFGGISITSVTPGSAGGTLAIIGGGQSLRYTPLPGFNGTEQFIYSLQDSVGSTSSATVTVNLLPGSRFDDVVDFTIGVFDPVNINTPVTNVQVGQDILVRVSVDDLRPFANPEGVASAFLDLLYTDELVATLNTDNNPDFPFDISFGPLFSGINVFQQGNSQTPGLIDEVGGVQRIDGQQPHSGPVELFTLRMRAVSPGVAVFTGDPADEDVSETTVLASDVALTPSELRLGRAELLILPTSDNFTSAIDDSFPDGRDSDGNLITSGSAARSRLDVLDNDNLGPTGTVREFGLVTSPSFGNVLIDDNGTPTNLNDDFFSYRANANANGLERFTYVIVTDDNIRSTAEVTMALGNASANADVALDFALVSGDGSGTPLNSVGIGERFGVQIRGDDLRFNSTAVFAGFLDVLYDAGIMQPADTNQSDDFDFDVLIGPGFSGVAGAGTAARTGIIDEFGAAFATIPGPGGIPDPALLATIFFDAVGVGTANVVGSPADSFPAHDTLLLNEDQPVDVSRIRYDKLQITVTGGPGVPLQNFGLPQDVNNDGSVSPIDALLIINEMSRISPTALGEGESIVASQFYTDVNGDQRTSALDALQVINYLKRASDSEGLGEQVGQQLTSNATDLSTSSADVVFADLDQNVAANVAAADLPSQASASSVNVADSDDADEDEEDILDLLADDVSGLWS